MTQASWHFLTPEYPPDPGGVADYTQLLVTGLARYGEVVHVWAPATGRDGRDEGASVHRTSGFDARGLRALERRLSEFASPRRLFVQYVPTSLGFRGMNVPLIRWLRDWPEDLWVQFHEVSLGWQLWRKPHLHVIHGVQSWMASTLARRADRLFVSIDAWRGRLGREGERATWLPVPSNLPTDPEAAELERFRVRLGRGPWIAHFGTYGSSITRLLLPTLDRIAHSSPGVRFLLLGRGAQRVAELLPKERVNALGPLSAGSVAAALSVADLALQPYPDGISTRRSSAMAALALGVPLVSNSGPLTESFWDADVVALGKTRRPAELAQLCLSLLGDATRRDALARNGLRLYNERFAVERTLEALLPSRDGTLAGDR